MQRLLLLPILAALLLLPSLSRADAPSILDQIKTLPLKEGVMFDYKNHRVLNTLGFGVAGWKNAEIDLAYIGVDGLGVVANYNLKDLPVANFPIISLVQYLNIGYGVGYRTLTAIDKNDPNAKSDNALVHGPVVFIKLNF